MEFDLMEAVDSEHFDLDQGGPQLRVTHTKVTTYSRAVQYGSC